MAARKQKQRRMSAQVVEDEDYQLRYEIVAGIDVAKESAVVCVRMPPAEGRKHRTSHLQTVPATVPAIGELAAELGREAAAALIAEIGLDMSRFATPEALVSWAGLTPTARQSGPRKGRGKKGHGNTYAKRIAVLAAYAAANTDTFLGERFRRLASRPGGGGRKKAGCAVGRSILVIVWHLLNDPAARYRDLGPDWHARHTDRSRKARNAQRQLEALGYDVIITLREDAA